MSKFFEVRWHGRGGQGTVTGAKSLAEAVQGTDKYVLAFPDYGPERRGAPLRAFNRFSKQKIRLHTPVVNPDVVIIVDSTLIGNSSLLKGIDENTRFIVNTDKSAAEIKKYLNLDKNLVRTVPANTISYEIFKREIPNSAMLGAFASVCSEIISIDKLIEESKYIFAHNLGEELVAKNIDAIEKGNKEGDCV